MTSTSVPSTSVPVGTTVLIRGGRVLTPSADWHQPPCADIAVAGDTIVGIHESYCIEPGAAYEVIDARDHLVVPGFVNAHYHSHDVLAKGTLEEVPLESWRLYALPPQYPPRSVEEVHARTLLGALECLRSGMTTIQDMLTLYPYDERHMEAVMSAYDKVGIRVVFALQYADRKGIETIPFWKDTFPPDLHPLLSTAAEPERNFDLLAHFESTRLRAPAQPLVSWALGPSAPERCSPALMQRTIELARRYDLPVYSHIYESRGMALQARLTLPEYSGLLIRRLAEEGVLDPRFNFAHSVWLSREEIDLLAEHGAGVVLNPQGNLKMKCGIPPILALQQAGVRIGLGCDNCSCSDAQNMFVAMKLFALLAAVSDPVPGLPQAAAALRAATEGGADGARLGATVGRIAAGFKADLTLIDMHDPSWAPLNSAVRQLVHVEAGRGVRTVLVNGRVVVRDRRLATVDERTIYDAVQVVMPGFRKDFAEISARVARLQPWLDRAHRQIMDAELDLERLPFRHGGLARGA
ncbi:MAG: amidohydrolase family protein [Proteobacteria bacterium]|nr:amidohydrolase family protein [Pseudomonadota bacterium]